MAKPKTKAAGQPIIDVLHANDTPPAENSKSVIITKRPLMRDPMMAAPASDSATEPAEPAAPQTIDEPVAAQPLTVTHQLVIMPPSSSEPTLPAVVGTPAAAQPITDVTKPKPATVTETLAEPEPAEVKLDPLNQEAAEAQAEDEAAKRQAELAALVDNQTYFLPVDGVKRKRARYFVVLGAVLIVALAVAWADISLDAGIVTASGIPHTNFFQQTNVTTVDPLVSVPTSQTYTLPLSKFSLKLPASWTLDVTKSTAVQDMLTANSPSSNQTIGSTSVQFASGPTLSATPSTAVIDNVHYQKLSRITGAATYLQEAVVHIDSTHYSVIVSIVNANNLKVGDILINATPTFYTTNAASPAQLTAVTTRSGGFSSQAAAEKYQQLNAYQQARTILLSLASPKQ